MGAHLAEGDFAAEMGGLKGSFGAGETSADDFDFSN
jgi:hypothetical protein